MNKSFLIFLFTVSLVGIFFFGCAKETPRTDVTLELTSPDTIEALVEKDLNTIGTSYQDIDNFPESTPAQVTYVDSVEMQKPLRVQNDDSLYKGEESIDDSVITTSNVSLWGPDTDKTLEPLSPRETISVVPPPTGDVTALGEASSSTQLSPVGGTSETAATTKSSSFLQPKPATETSVITTPNSGYVYQGNQSSSGGYVGPSAVTSGNTYTVQAGDNLIRIARKFGVKVNDLCAVNGISRSQILKVGQVLQIPGEKAAVSNEPAQTKEVDASISSVVQPVQTQQAAAPAAAGTQKYTVQAGDSYWKLAKRFNSSVEELMSLNGTSSDKLRIGQTIVVPNR